VLTLAAAVRFLLLLLWSPELSGDALDYDRLAHSLVDGRGYVNARGEPSSFRPPLYPAFVAAGYAPTDEPNQAAQIVTRLLEDSSYREATICAGLKVAAAHSWIHAARKLRASCGGY
jgi:hypothetical protein